MKKLLVKSVVKRESINYAKCKMIVNLALIRTSGITFALSEFCIRLLFNCLQGFFFKRSTFDAMFINFVKMCETHSDRNQCVPHPDEYRTPESRA